MRDVVFHDGLSWGASSPAHQIEDQDDPADSEIARNNRFEPATGKRLTYANGTPSMEPSWLLRTIATASARVVDGW